MAKVTETEHICEQKVITLALSTGSGKLNPIHRRSLSSLSQLTDLTVSQVVTVHCTVKRHRIELFRIIL